MAGTAPAEAAIAYDPQQRFIQLVGGGNGVVYAIQADGSLYWYRHLGYLTGEWRWASGSGRKIGSGWNEFRTVFGSTDGSFYAVRGDGTIRYYRYQLTDSTTGAGSWVADRQIGSGFDKYPQVCGFDGVIYGQDADGGLYCHQYDPSTDTWPVYGQRISGNFKNSRLYADASGVFYDHQGNSIYWYRHLGNGTLAAGSRFLLGTGYRNLGIGGLIFAGQGALYCVPPDGSTVKQTGKLIYFRLTNYETAGTDRRAIWINSGQGRQVGSGWTKERQAALQGYATTPSVLQGGTASVAVSTSFSSFTASLVRLAPNNGAPTMVSGPYSATGGLQLLPVGFIHSGCGWSDRVQIPIPATLQPGLYAVRLEGPYQLWRHVPIVVRPAQPTNQIAVLLPTNTYNAYNDWGGHNQYCPDMSGARPLTLRRPSNLVQVEATGYREHTMWPDMLLMRWMTKQKLAFDCYEDTDLHASGDWLPRYRVLVLGSHPEYWSDVMRQRLVNYLAGGGRLIYPGGNGLYERVQFNADRSVVTYRRSDGRRDTYTDLGYPASQVLGVNYSNAGTYAPYKVVRLHPLLVGTGLTRGSTFGATGYNGAASGWETDAMLGLAGEADESEIIAQGQNPGGGAAMVVMEKANGAFVFSASSISFTGALEHDPKMSALFRNVFIRALQSGPTVQRTQSPMQRTAPTPARQEPEPLQ